MHEQDIKKFNFISAYKRRKRRGDCAAWIETLIPPLNDLPNLFNKVNRVETKACMVLTHSGYDGTSVSFLISSNK